jgi:predicted transposase YbfD/YdcC
MGQNIVEIFEKLADPRRGNGIRHKLKDVIIIGILAIICGYDEYTEMELFGEMKKEWLGGFLELPNGIPSHDTFGDIFAAIDPKALHEGFAQWVEAIRENISGEIVAIDGKSIRRSKDNANGKKATHIVSAWAQANRLVLGQIATQEKSNEITAIPELLELLEIKGCIVTIDAMGTQKDIASKIAQLGADYVLSLKGNHPDLLDDVSFYLENEVLVQSTENLKKCGQYAKTTEKSHGRYETRECYITKQTDWLNATEDWAGLKGFGLIVSSRQFVGEDTVSISKHYFIFSADLDAAALLQAKRSHWCIENNLHWSLDMVFGEDLCRARIGNAAENINVLRHLAMGLLYNESSVKASLKLKRKRCALSHEYLLKVLSVS